MIEVLICAAVCLVVAFVILIALMDANRYILSMCGLCGRQGRLMVTQNPQTRKLAGRWRCCHCKEEVVLTHEELRFQPAFWFY